MQFISFLELFRVVLAAHVYRLRIIYFWCSFIFIGVLSFFFFFISPPSTFPIEQAISITEGSSLADVAYQLQEQHVIRSRYFFIITTKIFANEHGVQAGTYIFSKPYDANSVRYRVTNGISDVALTQITFPEGITVREMAQLLGEKFPGFDTQHFFNEAISREGYLFPDTYRFMPSVTSEEVLTTLETTFATKTKILTPSITASEHTFSDIIIMASILEREARTLDEKKIIAGILWKRIENGMPLQVDAVFGYIQERDTYSPSFQDLQIDSPYNTYRHKGLPPGPISNPGLESIEAALTPTPTSYLYYLTGKDGKMYYAKTFEEHKQNRAKYLD